MTISTTTQRVTFDGTGLDTALPLGFKFYASSDLVVTSRVASSGAESLLTLGSHYTVTGGNGETGTVTVVDGATNFPTTVTWTITRTSPQTQALDLVQNDAFPAESVEAQLDKLALQIQDLQEQVARSLKYPKTDATSLDSELPSSVDRASEIIDFDASGNVTTVSQADQSALTVTATGSTTTRSHADRWARWFDVVDYGATGDGATDDTAAIQAAIDAAESNGFGMVFFPGGSYRVTATLTVQVGGIVLIGEGDGVTQGLDTASGSNATSTGDTLIWLDNGAADMSGAVIHFAPASATDNLRSCGIDRLMISGRVVGGSNSAQPEFGLLLENVEEFRAGFYRTEFCRVAGTCIRTVTGASDGAGTRACEFGRIVHTWGTDTAGAEKDAFAVIIGNSASAINCTQLHVERILCSYQDGGGVQYVGDVDNCYIEHLQASRTKASGDEGIGVSLAFDDLPAGLTNIRNNYHGYVTGSIRTTTDVDRNFVRLWNSEGGFNEVQGSGQISFDHAHESGTGARFYTPAFIMHDELTVSATDMASFSAVAATLVKLDTAVFVPVFTLVDAATSHVSFAVRAPRTWTDGHLRKVRLVYALDTGSGGAKDVKYQLAIATASAASGSLAHPTSGAGFLDTVVSVTANANQANTVEIAIPDENAATAGISFFEGELINVQFTREGGDAADTLDAVDFKLIAMDITYESVGPYNSLKAPFVQADVNTTNNTIAVTDAQAQFGYTGLGPVRFISTDDDLPAPLQSDTSYWVINGGTSGSDILMKLATTQANAIAGTAISLTDQGSASATHWVINGWEPTPASV